MQAQTQAQAWPAKPIRLVVPFPPGASNDVLSRITAQAMSPGLGQQIVVENRPGGGGIVGTEAVARSPGDGYSMLNIQASFVANAALRPRLPYEPIADFAYVGMMARGPLPQVPTIAESGVPGYMAEFWWGLLVPVKTSAEITAQLGSELARALQSTDLRQSFAGEGAEPATMGAEAFQRFVSNEINRWRKVAQETGIKPE